MNQEKLRKIVADSPLLNHLNVEAINERETVLTPAGEPVCDFCSSTPIAKDYDCKDCYVGQLDPETANYSQGQWGACAVCARLIDNGDRLGLLNRSVDLFLKRDPRLNRVDVRDGVVAGHNAFFANRIVAPA